MATTQLQRQPATEVLIAKLVATSKERERKGQSDQSNGQPIKGNVNAKDVGFATKTSIVCTFKGTASAYVGNSGITGTLSNQIKGDVYFLFNVDADDNILRTWFYKDAQHTEDLGELTADGSFTEAAHGSGTGTFTVA